jgi:hypothetical protein
MKIKSLLVPVGLVLVVGKVASAIYQEYKSQTCCVDCGKPTEQLYYGGELRCCEPCMKSRIERAIGRRKAEIEATTPPGLSAEILWLLVIVLFVVWLFVR